MYSNIFELFTFEYISSHMPSLPIQLPHGFSPIISVGENVSVRQPIATKKADGDTAVINISRELSLPVVKAGKAMKVNPGDTVSSGTVIASRSGMLGMGGQKVVSSVEGEILSFDRRSGEVTIRINGAEKGDEEAYLSPVAGKITMCDNEQIVIETETDGSLSESGSGGTIKGELYLLKYDQDSAVPLHLLTTEIIGKIVACRTLNREGLLKAVGMEAIGIVTRSLAPEDLLYLSEKHIEIPVVQVSEDEYQKISKRVGKEIYLDGDKKSVVLLQT
jgi:hypothetical protein